MTASPVWVRAQCRTIAACGLACILTLGVACGKKGPPLAPLVRLPAAVEQVTAARLGHDVYLSFTVPRTNVDRSTPIDVSYIDVYAYTGMTAPLRAMFVERATHIARVPVTPPAEPGGPAPPPAEGAVALGAPVTIRDPATDLNAAGLRRFYLVVPFSSRGRPGAQHNPVDVPFAAVPAAPPAPQLALTASGVTISWPAAAPAVTTPASGATPTTPGAAPQPPASAPTPGAPAPAGIAPPVTAPAGPPGAAPAAQAPATPGPPRMNVYRVPADETGTAESALAVRPMPLNMAPLAAPPFAHAAPMGAQICYVLRQVIGDGATAVEGDASAPSCVTPLDTYPPAAPTQVVAVATAGGINLLWEANTEPDLGGYLILRGVPGDAMLQPLTPTPIMDTRYADTTVMSGMRYVYAVVAVDTRMPTPNVSAESARVEETAQ